MVSGGARFARGAFVFFAAVFLLCIGIQVFMAGLAIFENPVYWAWHRSFVHFFELLPLILLGLAFAGRLPAGLRWQSAGLFALIFAQYFTANVRAVLPWAAATHPVIALGIFWVAARTLMDAWRHRFQSRQAPHR
jgi:hypothetical protein